MDNLDCHIHNFIGLHTNIKFKAIFKTNIVNFLITHVVIDFNGNHHIFFGWILKRLLTHNGLLKWHYEKKGCSTTNLATQFLSCIRHLQLIIFICCEYYKTSCKSCKNCNLPYIRCNSLQLNYNFVVTTPFQVLCNSPMTTIIMSCWRHFLSIHKKLTCGTMKFFRVSIVHYDYLF